MQKSIIKEMAMEERSLGQQLHDLRVSKQLTVEEVFYATKIPIHIIDKHEIGMFLQMNTVFTLAKYYHKTVHFSLVDRE